MYRTLSPSDEEAIRQLFNTTADQLGISRPLDIEGWYKIKDHLLAQSVDDIPEGWAREYVRLNERAFSRLSIDPLPSWKSCVRKGPKALLSRLLSSLEWSSMTHDIVGEFTVGTTMLALASVFGTLALLLTHHLGVTSAIWPFVVGSFIALMLPIGPGDARAGATGLLFLLSGAYSLATGNWGLAESIRIAVASFGVLFGAATVFLGWLPLPFNHQYEPATTN